MKIVVKVGTSTLTQGQKKLSRRFMLELSRQLALLQEEKHKLILVSSGAITAGKEILDISSKENYLSSKQMLASIGQVHLMHIWGELFSLFEISIAQILLTKEDLSNRKRYLNARDTLFALLHHEVLPIINENDTTATHEIKVGDNDNLAALTANLIGADLLILLTDQEGLYTKDPRTSPDAKLIPEVKKIEKKIFELAGGASSPFGTGGMTTKIEAAKIATQCGIKTIIASSNEKDVLLKIVQGQAIGTTFLTETTPRESRKRWLLAEKTQGWIEVDEGAASKITHHGASLLALGIINVSHPFERGAIVEILSPSKEAIAIGMTNYNDQEITKLIGHHSKKIDEILGYTYGDEVIHRTNMTRL